MRSKELQLGTVSPGTERTLLLLLLAAAAILRLTAWRSLGPQVTEIAGVARPAVAWLLPLLGLLTVARLYTLLRRWMDLPTALVASGLWSLVGLAVAPPAEAWPEQLAALLLLQVVAEAMRVAELRRPQGSWRLGAALGAAGAFSGVAWIWWITILVWLPLVSRRLRGLVALRMGLEVSGAALLTCVVLSLGLTLTPVERPGWPGADRVLVGLHRDDLGAPFTRHDGASQAALDAWLGFEMAESNVRSQDSPLPRQVAIQKLLWNRLAEAPWHHLRVGLRRAVAQLSAWPGLGSPRWGLPVVPWPVVVLASWLGVLALLPSWRRYWPFFVGILAPLLQVAVCGLTVASLLLALPFYCTLSGYGLVRLAVGRSSVWTWLLGGLLLALAWAAHNAVLVWS